MPALLIKDNEKLVFEADDDAKIFYRRVSRGVIEGLVSKHTTTRRGTNWPRVTREVMEHAIQGWEGFTDGEKEVPYAPELIDAIPGYIYDAFADVLLEGRGDRISKNSKPTPKAG